jgi:hypothetical protein
MELNNIIFENTININDINNLESNIKLPDKYPDLSYEK